LFKNKDKYIIKEIKLRSYHEKNIKIRSSLCLENLSRRQTYRSITNNDHIIKHLNYYGLEIFNDKVILKEIMLNQDDEYCKIRFDIEVLLIGGHYKVELLFKEEENFSLNKFLIIDYFKLSLETLKEIDEAINYFFT